MHARIAKLLGVAALVAASVFSARYALADYYYDRAKRVYNSLNSSRLVYSHELAPVLADINRSLSLRRNSSKSLDFKADLLYQSWLLSPDGQYFSQSRLLQSAAGIHIEALSLRENWAFSSARLALIHSHKSKLGSEFEHWYRESHRLGLYETKIARSLMILGLQRWLKLTEAQQGLTLDFVRTSIEQKANSSKAMILLLDRYEKRGEACFRLPSTPRKDKVCADLDESV